MVERLGNALYWLCNMVAALIVLCGVLMSISGPEHFYVIAGIIIALAIYGLGRGIRYVLAGK
jgi:hypothetical protein